MVSISLLMLSCWTTDQWLGKFAPLILMLVGKRVLVWWPKWCIDFGMVHAAVFCTWSYYHQAFCFLVRPRKQYGPWEIHTKSLSFDQMNTGDLWAPWCILATWTQELVSVSYGFRKVHTGPCGRTGLEHLHDQPAGLYRASKRPVWSLWDSVRGP